MRRARRHTLAALVTLAALAAATAAPTHADVKGPLAQTGRWIVDADGRVVTLHGVNLVSKIKPYLPSKTGFSDDDAAFLSTHGFDTVRLGVIYAGVEPQPGVYDEAYLDGIASTVHTLAAHGIWVLLDFHQDLYNERYQGEGFPDWATLDDGQLAEPRLGFPGNYLAMPALNRAFDNFYANAPGPGGVGIQDRYADAWKHVAARFKNASNLLGYDLLNEPWPGSQWATCLPLGCPELDKTLTAFTQRVTDRIREVDTKGIVFYEPNVFFNNGIPTSIGPVQGPAAMSFHVYCLQGAPADQQSNAQEDATCPPFERQPIANAQEHATANADGMLLSEFGATQDLKEIGRVVGFADEGRVGWQYWHYCDCDDPTTSGGGGTQSVVIDPRKPPTGANVRQAKLAVLARTYPIAVAGDPSPWTFDQPTGRFEARWSTRGVGGQVFPAGSSTEIVTPAIQYPAGYDVAVQGAEPASAPNAPRLVMRSCAGRTDVHVVVTRGTGRVTADCKAPAVVPPRLRAVLSPRRLTTGRLTRVAVTVKAGGSPVRSAVVLISRRRARTNARGVARFSIRYAKAGRKVVHVRAGGLRTTATLTVVKPARKRRR